VSTHRHASAQGEILSINTTFYNKSTGRPHKIVDSSSPLVLTFAQVYTAIKANNMLSPAQLKLLAFNGLTEPQQEAATGLASDPAILLDDDLGHCNRYFDVNANDTVRKFLLGSANAILFLHEGSFKILSTPKLTLDAYGAEIFVGQDGNSLFHLSPISIQASEATSKVMTLIFVSTDPSDPSALHSLGATRYVVESSVITSHEDDAEVITTITFPFPPEPVDGPFNFKQYKVAALPVAVPLPPGHSLNPVAINDPNSLADFLEQIENISQQHYEWVNSILVCNSLYDGQSLHCHKPPVPAFFTEGLTSLAPFKDRVSVSVSPTNPTSIAGKDFLRRANAIRNDNMDRWFTDNTQAYQALVAPYLSSNESAPLAGSGAPASSAVTPTVVYESLKDKTTKVNIARARAITSLLLARETTASDGTKVITPGIVSQMFEDAISDSTSRAVRYFLQEILSLRNSKVDSMDSVNILMARFPIVVITSSLVATALNGFWSTQPLQQEMGMVGQNLNLLSFAPVRTNTAEHKRQLEESTTVLNEDLVGVATNQRTKATLHLFGGGTITTHQDVLQTIANLVLFLESLDAPDQPSPPLFVTALRQLFQCLVNPIVNNWVHSFTRRPEGKHLPYSLAFEINNGVFIHFAKFATSSTWTRAALEGTEIPISALADFNATFNVVLSNWRKISATDSLSIYSSPPSTWISPETKKEESKKVAKTSEYSSPSSKPSNKSGTTSNTSNSARLSPKDPLFGMVIVPDNLRHGPQLPTGKRLCLHFAGQGKACVHGYNCQQAHVTLNRASIPELKAIERWVLATPNVDWALGRPKRLTDSPPAATLNTDSPRATSAPAPVTPAPAPAAQG
jgi:hypothetical protein